MCSSDLNGFLAMKLTFVNEIAALCEGVGADIDDVVRGLGSDPRIGREFLRPGPGWGGSCFPKDSRALVSISAGHGYDFSIMRLVLQMNEVQKERIVEACRALRDGPSQYALLSDVTCAE